MQDSPLASSNVQEIAAFRLSSEVNLVPFSRENTKNRIRLRIRQQILLLALKGCSQTALLVALPLWAALVCAAQTLSSQTAAQSPPSGLAPFAGALISEWRGSVQVQLPGGSATHPTRGQVLPEGTVLETREGQMVLVLRSDESEILIQPHTRLILQAPQPGSWDALQIILGKVRAYIRKRTGGAPPFQMGTPSAVIAVRGTRFDVEVNSSGISEIDVFEGLVEVASNTVQGASVLVIPGMSTRVGIGSAPEIPLPTREIRPDVEVPDQIAKLEFAREKALQADRGWDVEFGERPDAEVSELVDESRESEKGKH